MGVNVIIGTTTKASDINRILTADFAQPKPWNKSLHAVITTPSHTGTADTNLTMALKDTGNNFAAVTIGAIVENTTDHVFATVLYKSGADTLYLNWDAFPDGDEDYKVYDEPSVPDNHIELTGALLDGDGTKVADTNTINHLKDGDGTDWTTIISVGDWAMNLSTGLVAKVTTVGAHDLTLQWDCFPNGNEPYMLWANMIEIDDADSLLDNVIIPEMNISGRFVRPGMTAEIVQEDTFQGHRFGVGSSYLITISNGNFASNYNLVAMYPNGGGSYRATMGLVTDTINGAARFGNETKPRNLSMVMIMRIK